MNRFEYISGKKKEYKWCSFEGCIYPANPQRPNGRCSFVFHLDNDTKSREAALSSLLRTEEGIQRIANEMRRGIGGITY